ncbi:glycosyltransferase family 39 protein [Actinokineospora xionganensis]|uniref:Glycosyltransferase family 39 protein n=1 Tax=Actinokineospora xionganensis TaxID=2684470 RepID=A0ABR7L6R7_9PSEU|nr:glycosyltransferase family 39 protein [Actinokineospora xionganensis]MBC6447997.1 glycosyltransferase family 39 protein [Actinokineospora xionganensis]
MPGDRWVRLVGWWDRHARAIVLAAVAGAVLLAGGFALAVGDALRFQDEREYVALARSVASGHGYVLTEYSVAVRPPGLAYRPPGLPFLLAPVSLLTDGSIVAMRFVGVAALGVSVWLASLLGRRIHSPAAGALAAVGVAAYPLFVFTATTLYPQIPAMALLLGFLESAFRAVDESRRGRWVAAAGLTGGLLALTLPVFALAVPLTVVWLAWSHRRALGRAARNRALAGVLLLAITLACVWTVRNAVVLGAFVPASTNGGVNLLLGNSERVTARTGSAGDIGPYYAVVLDDGLDEVEADRFYTVSAWEWVRGHPGDAARLYVEKVARAFAYADALSTEYRPGVLTSLLSALTFYPVLGLAVLRVLLARRRLGAEEKLLLGLVVMLVAVLAVYFIRIRLRLPLDALLIVVAASGALSLARGSVHANHGRGQTGSAVRVPDDD